MLFKAAAVLAAIAIVVAGVQTYRLSALKGKHASQTYELQSCGARLKNIIEDLKSDTSIDALPDSALTTVPDGWLRKP